MDAQQFFLQKNDEEIDVSKFPLAVAHTFHMCMNQEPGTRTPMDAQQIFRKRMMKK
jgi:hypothetical protein